MNRTIKDPASEIALEGLVIFKDDFISSRREDILKIQDALGGEDFAVVKRFCHTWRGFAVPYGFGELSHYATELEEALGSGHGKICLDILHQIETYLSSK